MADALAANALTTLRAVEDELSVDGYVERVKRRLLSYINAASDFAADFCRREFHYQASIVESLPGRGDQRLVVTSPPLLSITSITFDETTIDSDDYSIEDAGAGLIYRRTGWITTAGVVSAAAPFYLPGSEEKRFVVTYEGGWVTPYQVEQNDSLTRTLPYDLEEAVIAMIVRRFRSKGRDRDIESEKLMSYSVKYRTGGDDGVSPEVLEVLSKYKRESYP